MKKIFQFSLILLVLAFTTNQATAQKIGYVDAQSLVIEMPAFKSARSSLNALQTQFEKQLEAQQTKIQEKFKSAQQKAERGELSQVQQAQLEQELVADQEKWQESQQKYKNDLLRKEEELTAPLYDKIREAIKTVAQANGYSHVLESASMLYADESSDITDKVKSTLGM